MKDAKPGAAMPLAIVAVLGIGFGCATREAWQHDESRRIADIIGSEKFSEDLPEVKGTPFLAAESAAPPLSTSKYAIQNAPPKKRPKSSRSSNTRGVGASSHSKGRQKREEQLTSQSAEADSSSRQP